jgi:hypothetical protein
MGHDGERSREPDGAQRRIHRLPAAGEFAGNAVGK